MACSTSYHVLYYHSKGPSSSICLCSVHFQRADGKESGLPFILFDTCSTTDYEYRLKLWLYCYELHFLHGYLKCCEFWYHYKNKRKFCPWVRLYVLFLVLSSMRQSHGMWSGRFSIYNNFNLSNQKSPY
jgi:hypothetical protein